MGREFTGSSLRGSSLSLYTCLPSRGVQHCSVGRLLFSEKVPPESGKTSGTGLAPTLQLDLYIRIGNLRHFIELKEKRRWVKLPTPCHFEFGHVALIILAPRNGI